MTTARILAAAPVLLVKNVQKAADHYRDALGFRYDRLWGDPPNFCLVARDGISLFLAQMNDPRQTVVPHWKLVDKMWSAYFWVDNVDALYAEVQARGAMIDYTLYVAPWGNREFGVQDIDGHDIGFGQVMG